MEATDQHPEESSVVQYLVENRLSKSKVEAEAVLRGIAVAKVDGLGGIQLNFSRVSGVAENTPDTSVSEDAGALILPGPVPTGSPGAGPASARNQTDDNDLFGSALNLEEQHIAEGREAGRRDGMEQGFEEGISLGKKKAFEISQQIGYYSGCLQVWRHLQGGNPALFPPRAQRAIDSLEASISSFPLDNPEDERMQIALDDLDGRFKAILAILGVTDKYFPKTSDAASLDF